MRKLTVFLLALLFAGHSLILKAQTDMTLTNKQQTLITLAALEASGNIPVLETVLGQALNDDIEVSTLKECLSHLYAYTGFPRSLNALGALQRVLAERQRQGITDSPGREATPLAADYDALRQGSEVQARLGGGKPFEYSFAPQTDYYLKAHLFGDIFARDILTFAERELVTLGAIAALEGCEAQLKAHVAGSRNMGVSDEELRQLPAVLARNVGREQAMRAKNAVEEVLGITLNEPADQSGSMPPSPWKLGTPNTAYARYFIGNSYLAPYDAENGGPVNVTFEPRCRNNWHIHHGSVQVLICVSGRGWYVEEGKEPMEMTPGTVVAIPPEARHWHGAARDQWFQHLTYMTRVEANASNEWLEPVTDEEYNRLP